MRTTMHSRPGEGASPSTELEYGFDGFTANAIIAACDEIRGECKVLAASIATRLDALDLWASDLDGKSAEVKLKRLSAALDELIDDFMHQGKIEEAGEVA